MSGQLSADEIRKLLELEPNAAESKQSVAPGSLPAPFADGRPLGSALYFIVTPHAPVPSHPQ
jgi:uncharacterized protein